MQWFYSKDGQQQGPVDFSEIQRLHTAGELTGESLVWKQGTSEWVKLSTVLSGGAAPAGSVPPPVAAAPKTLTLAIVAMVLGLLSFLCCGPFFSIPAIICGHIALSKIARETNLSGKPFAIVGLVAGYLNILVVLYVILFTDFRAQFQQAYEEGLRKAQESEQTTP